MTEKFEYLSASNFGESQHKNYINPESEILTWLLNQPLTSPSFNLITELLSKFPCLQNTYQSHSIKSQTLSSIAKLDRVTDHQLSTFFQTKTIISFFHDKLPPVEQNKLLLFCLDKNLDVSFQILVQKVAKIHADSLAHEKILTFGDEFKKILVSKAEKLDSIPFCLLEFCDNTVHVVKQFGKVKSESFSKIIVNHTVEEKTLEELWKFQGRPVDFVPFLAKNHPKLTLVNVEYVAAKEVDDVDVWFSVFNCLEQNINSWPRKLALNESARNGASKSLQNWASNNIIRLVELSSNLGFQTFLISHIPVKNVAGNKFLKEKIESMNQADGEKFDSEKLMQIWQVENDIFGEKNDNKDTETDEGSVALIKKKSVKKQFRGIFDKSSVEDLGIFDENTVQEIYEKITTVVLDVVCREDVYYLWNCCFCLLEIFLKVESNKNVENIPKICKLVYLLDYLVIEYDISTLKPNKKILKSLKSFTIENEASLNFENYDSFRRVCNLNKKFTGFYDIDETECKTCDVNFSKNSWTYTVSMIYYFKRYPEQLTTETFNQLGSVNFKNIPDSVILQIISKFDFSKLEPESLELNYLTKVLVSKYAAKNLAKYVDLKKIDENENKPEDLVDILLWNSLSQARCMRIFSNVCKHGFSSKNFMLIIQAADRLLQRSDPAKTFKNYMPILATVLNRLVREFHGEKDFSEKFVRLCNLLSARHKKTFDRGISGVLVECLGVRSLEEACCYLLACMDENQIPMVNGGLREDRIKKM